MSLLKIYTIAVLCLTLTVSVNWMPCILQINREVERLTGKDVHAALGKFLTQGRVTKLNLISN